MATADQIKSLRDYVKALEGENQSKNRERQTLEIQLKDLSAQNDRLRSAANPDMQNHMMRQFEDLRFTYNRMEIELTNRINHLEAANRILEAEKLRIENECTTWKNKADSNRTSTVLTIDQHSDYNKRIAQLNKIIVDLNQEINLLRNNAHPLPSEAVAEMRAVIEELHRENKKLQSQRDLLTNKVAIIEKEVVQLRTEMSRRIAEKSRLDALQKERINLVNEVASLKGNSINLTRTVEVNNKKTEQKELQNNNLRTQIRGLEASIGEFRLREEQYKTQVTRLRNDIEVQKAKMNSRNAQQNEIVMLSNANNQLSSQIIFINQQKQHLEIEIQRNLDVIREANEKIYILETANYNLSEELKLSIHQRKVSAGSQTIIQALKEEIIHLKNDNHKFSEINKELLEEYRQLDERFQTLQSRYKHDIASRDPSKVFIQKWNDADQNRQSPFRNRVYRANPVDGQDPKWIQLQKKILNLKAQNQELKRSLNFGQI